MKPMSAHCLLNPVTRYNAVLAHHDDLACMDFSPPQWHVLWTRSNCEQLVSRQLAGKGYEVFLPELEHWSERGGLRCASRSPTFPGYVFLRHAVDRWTYLDISKTRGVVKLLGDSWDRLATVPEREVSAVRTVHRTAMPCMSHPYTTDGRRVRIVRGPLANIEGILIRRTRTRGLLVLSIELLRQSLAVQVDCDTVEPA